MAKEKQPTIFDRIDKLNAGISKAMAGVKDSETPDLFKTFGAVREHIGTGNYLVNAQMTASLFGGIPSSRSVELAGPSGSGKTFLCLNIAYQAQLMGYYIYYIDTEGALEDEDLQRFSINPNMCKHVRTMKMYSQLRHFVNTIIAMKSTDEYKDIKIMIIVDSYGMLNTNKEIEDGRKGKNAADMGLRAKEGRQLFRNIILDVSNLGIPLVFTNHTGATLDLFAAEKEIPSGGGGPTYAASIILFIDKRPLREGPEGATTKTGIIVKSKTFKNRISQPHEAYFHISFSKGMNPYVGLDEYISWENCGVVRGTILSDEEFNKKYKKGVAVNSTGKELVTHTWKEGSDTYRCVENNSAKTYAVKDTKENVPVALLFTSKVFTMNTLKMLDENVIKPKFKYKTIEEVMQEELVDLSKLNNKEEDEVAEAVFNLAKTVADKTFDLNIKENE